MELEQFNQPTIQFLDGMESQLLGLDCHEEGAIKSNMVPMGNHLANLLMPC